MGAVDFLGEKKYLSKNNQNTNPKFQTNYKSQYFLHGGSLTKFKFIIQS